MTATQRDLVVIAIGGNSLISARDKKSVADQYDAICATVAHIADVIESGRRVVITHGTDTMAYTAAALSYLIQGSPKPIVLTGAQRPIGFDSTDSKTNLADAFRCAAEDLPGVSIVFNSRVILGTRAKKTRSKSFQAFSSINHPELGVLRDGVLLRYIRQDCREAPVFYDRLDPRVALLKLVPGTGLWLTGAASTKPSDAYSARAAWISVEKSWCSRWRTPGQPTAPRKTESDSRSCSSPSSGIIAPVFR